MKLKLILVIVAVGLLAFGAAFGVAAIMRPKTAGATAKPNQTPTTGEASALPDATASAAAALERPHAREQQLDDLARLLQAKLADVKRREDKLVEEEKQLTFAREVLKKEAQDLEELRVKLVAPLNEVKEAQARLAGQQLAIARGERENIKKLATLYEKMDTAQAAQALQKMCENSAGDDAVRLLYYMQGKAAAKVLAEMTDKALVARITERLKSVSEES